MDVLIERIRRIPCAGIGLGLLSGVFLATAGVAVPVLSINPIEIVITRNIVQAVFCVPIVLFSNPKSFFGIRGQRLPLLLRGIFGFGSFACSYTAFAMIPFGDASTVLFSSPVICSLVAYFFLKEAIALFHILLLAITMTGVILISRPAFIFQVEDMRESSLRLQGSLVALTGAVCMACAFVSVRKMPDTTPIVILSAFAIIAVLCGLIVLLPVCYWFQGSVGSLSHNIRWPTTVFEIGLMILNGVCGIAGQMCLTIALKVENAGLIALSRSIEVVTAFAFQALWLQDQEIMWMSMAGAACVCTSIALSAVRRWLSENQGKAPILWSLVNCSFCEKDTTADDVTSSSITVRFDNEIPPADSAVQFVPEKIVPNF